jgi:23S rRNA C2498 (ribose-2'-O)-methylase RlmM
MKHYIYRIKYKDYILLRQTDIIANKLDKLSLEDKDKVIIIVSKSMNVIGAFRYNKEQDFFVREKEINKVISKFYDALPMVEFVTENTYKMFSKRLREITKEDYDAFLC